MPSFLDLSGELLAFIFSMLRVGAPTFNEPSEFRGWRATDSARHMSPLIRVFTSTDGQVDVFQHTRTNRLLGEMAGVGEDTFACTSMLRLTCRNFRAKIPPLCVHLLNFLPTSSKVRSQPVYFCRICVQLDDRLVFLKGYLCQDDGGFLPAGFSRKFGDIWAKRGLKGSGKFTLPLIEAVCRLPENSRQMLTQKAWFGELHELHRSISAIEYTIRNILNWGDAFWGDLQIWLNGADEHKHPFCRGLWKQLEDELPPAGTTVTPHFYSDPRIVALVRDEANLAQLRSIGHLLAQFLSNYLPQIAVPSMIPLINLEEFRNNN